MAAIFKMAAVLLHISNFFTNLGRIYIEIYLILHLWGHGIQRKLFKIKYTINFYNSNHFFQNGDPFIQNGDYFPEKLLCLLLLFDCSYEPEYPFYHYFIQ